MFIPIKFSWRVVGLWYLALPVVLFFSFWLLAPYNILFSIMTLGVCLKYSVDLSQSETKTLVNYRYLILTLCISLLFAILSGAGGFVWQKHDWTKHNVVLNDLINYQWPVYYGPSAYVKDTTLVYYVAYYLPSALIGKLFGWRAGELGLFFQTFMGLFIFAQLIGESIRYTAKKFILYFLLSGADILGFLVFHNQYTNMLSLEYYASSLQFSAVMTQLMWVPQHALAGWVAVMLAYKDYQEGTLLRTLPLYVAITFLWSPFVSLGLALAFGPLVFSFNIKQYAHWYMIAGASISGMILLYFQSQMQGLSNGIELYVFSTTYIFENLGMMFGFLIFDLYIFLILFVLVKDKIQKSEAKLIGWLFFSLVLIAQIKYGIASDFVMRVSIPALTLIFVFILKYIDEVFRMKSFVAWFVVSLLVIGMCTPVVGTYHSFQRSESAVNERPIYPMTSANLRYKVLHLQYLGLATKAFGKYFGNYQITVK